MLTLREELFLLGHDEEQRFRSMIHSAALSVGLAGASLATLLIAGRARMSDGHLIALDRTDHTPTGDARADSAVRLLGGTRAAWPVAELLTTLTADLYDLTRDSLVASGVLQTFPRRFGIGRTGLGLTDPATTIRAVATQLGDVATSVYR